MAEQPLLFSEEALRRPMGEEMFAALKARALACTSCGLRLGCKQVVFGSGLAHRPDLAFIGEAPGASDDREGLPFKGPGGDLLDKMLGALGYTREKVYLANIVSCRPPGNRSPAPEELAACLPWLEQQLRAVQPRVIVTLGNTAAKVLLGVKDDTVEKLRGRWGEWEGVPVMPTFHPNHLLRAPEDKPKAWGDLQEVLKKVGKGCK